MTTALPRSPGATRPRTAARTDTVMTVLVAWFVLGLFLDAFAHATFPELETFFTPWHAVFYSGFTATAGWVLWTVYRHVQLGRGGPAAVPLGYGMTMVALPVFALSGLADAAWHIVLGIETGTDIFFSPSHLGLIASMVVIATSPLRSAWADPDAPAPTWPAVVSLAFGTGLVLLFLSYGNAIFFSPGGVADSLSTDDDAARFAARVVLTNLVLLAPVLLLARRWPRLPFGAATAVFAVAALVSWVLDSLEDATGPLSIVAAGVVVDVLARLLRPSAQRRNAYWGFAAAAGFAAWAAFVGVACVVAGRLPAIPELWTGLPIVTGLVGWLLAALMLPSPRA